MIAVDISLRWCPQLLKTTLKMLSVMTSAIWEVDESLYRTNSSIRLCLILVKQSWKRLLLSFIVKHKLWDILRSVELPTDSLSSSSSVSFGFRFQFSMQKKSSKLLDMIHSGVEWGQIAWSRDSVMVKPGNRLHL